MEQLYPQNILERHYPVLREQREREERERDQEEAIASSSSSAFSSEEVVLYENEPLEAGSVGRSLNTVA